MNINTKSLSLPLYIITFKYITITKAESAFTIRLVLGPVTFKHPAISEKYHSATEFFSFYPVPQKLITALFKEICTLTTFLIVLPIAFKHIPAAPVYHFTESVLCVAPPLSVVEISVRGIEIATIPMLHAETQISDIDISIFEDVDAFTRKLIV
jgi:hypothetical protein